MTLAEDENPSKLVGLPVRRPNVRRLIHGHGKYTDDITLPHMLHVAFVRSPYGHAQIGEISIGAAEASPGVVALSLIHI